jgi:hypothetical protein
VLFWILTIKIKVLDQINFAIHNDEELIALLALLEKHLAFEVILDLSRMKESSKSI